MARAQASNLWGLDGPVVRFNLTGVFHVCPFFVVVACSSIVVRCSCACFLVVCFLFCLSLLVFCIFFFHFSKNTHNNNNNKQRETLFADTYQNTLIMATIQTTTNTPPSTPASHSELFFSAEQQQRVEEEEEERRLEDDDEESFNFLGVDPPSLSSFLSLNNNDGGDGDGVNNKRAMTLQLKRASLFHALAKEADEKAKRDADEALRKKRETQANIRKTLDSQKEQKRLAKEKEKMVERMLDTQQRRTAEKLDEERKRKETEKRQLDQERAREAEFEMRKAREEKALSKKQDVERAAEFVRKAEEAGMLDTKRAEEEEALLLVEANGARRRRRHRKETSGVSRDGREKVSFGGEEEDRSARGAREERERNETTERFEVAREFGSASGGKRTERVGYGNREHVVARDAIQRHLGVMSLGATSRIYESRDTLFADARGGVSESERREKRRGFLST